MWKAFNGRWNHSNVEWGGKCLACFKKKWISVLNILLCSNRGDFAYALLHCYIATVSNVCVYIKQPTKYLDMLGESWNHYIALVLLRPYDLDIMQGVNVDCPWALTAALTLPSWQHETAAALWNLSLPSAVYIAARHPCYSTDGIPPHAGHYICRWFRKQPECITMSV